MYSGGRVRDQLSTRNNISAYPVSAVYVCVQSVCKLFEITKFPPLLSSLIYNSSYRRRVRYESQVLLRLHGEFPAHRPERRARLRSPTQDDLQVHEDRRRGHESLSCHLRFLPRLQVPGLHGSEHKVQGGTKYLINTKYQGDTKYQIGNTTTPPLSQHSQPLHNSPIH